MHARTEPTHPPIPATRLEIRNGGRTSFGLFVRRWGPYVVTALVVPGGILIALLLLWRRWNQGRQSVQSPAGA